MIGDDRPCPELIRQRQLVHGIVEIGLPRRLVMGDEVLPGAALGDDQIGCGHSLHDRGDLLAVLDPDVGHVGGVVAEFRMRAGIGLGVALVLDPIATEPEGHG